jgi:hypothetical protein
VIAPSPAEAREATLRIGATREPNAIVPDLLACARVLVSAVGSWNGEPHNVALISAETSAEGCRRLLQELRIAIANQRRALNDARIPAQSESGT